MRRGDEAGDTCSLKIQLYIHSVLRKHFIQQVVVVIGIDFSKHMVGLIGLVSIAI